jgi:chaperone required for assembly of F1-ATPase
MAKMVPQKQATRALHHQQGKVYLRGFASLLMLAALHMSAATAGTAAAAAAVAAGYGLQCNRCA